jgi:2'-5' RNA ligase
MDTIRTFIALDMPADIKAALEKYVQPLKASLAA